MYAVGWGPTLAIGLAFGAADNLRASGSRASAPAAFWTVVDIGLGELAIAIGVAPSLIGEPLVHGLAMLAVLGTTFTVFLFGSATADKERAEHEVAQREARFRALVQHAADIIMVLDGDGQIQYVSPAFEHVLGYDAVHAIGTRALELAHPDDVDGAAQSIEVSQVTGYDAARVEVRLRRRDGEWIWFDASVTSLVDDPNVRGIVANMRDISERKAIAERLTEAAVRDSLTGLPNRTRFLERTGVSLVDSRRKGTHVGVIFLDLDRFKLINDSLGHAAGDELLRILAQRLPQAVRPGDTVARLGGDEFVVLCSEIEDSAAVLDVARRVAEVVSQPIMLDRRELFVTASLGVVVSRGRSDSPENLLRDADAAMYRAKENGRGRIELFDGATHRRAMASLELGTDLHHAVERTEFEIYYQPIVDLTTGLVNGFEALLRWRHPNRGLIQPDEFIPLAEETGLIVPIGAWVLEEACSRAVLWQTHQRREAPVQLSINLAPRQLVEPSLVSDLEATLRATGIAPDTVWLELTESALMEDAEQTIVVLEALRALGVHLAVDDFGTGYSSLAYLKRFPVEALKVDRTFVDGLGRKPEDTTIVGAVVGLAHSLGIVAVAEGLETSTQLGELRAMGCDLAQGFLFGKPKPAHQLGEYPVDDLRNWQPETSL
jgi:diguanylate cyclase (GGDEF)-like protein/PAS domain S-box-containing protein